MIMSNKSARDTLDRMRKDLDRERALVEEAAKAQAWRASERAAALADLEGKKRALGVAIAALGGEE